MKPAASAISLALVSHFFTTVRATAFGRNPFLFPLLIHVVAPWTVSTTLNVSQVIFFSTTVLWNPLDIILYVCRILDLGTGPFFSFF